jgi:hypothetical protein
VIPISFPPRLCPLSMPSHIFQCMQIGLTSHSPPGSSRERKRKIKDSDVFLPRYKKRQVNAPVQTPPKEPNPSILVSTQTQPHTSPPQPSKNPLIQPPSHQLFRQNILTPPPIALMLPIQRLHSRAHTAQRPPTSPPIDILGRGSRRSRIIGRRRAESHPRSLRDQGSAADGGGEGTLGLLGLL